MTSTGNSDKSKERHVIPTYTPGWLITIALLAFIAAKIPHLGLPFFGDETSAYGKMIFALADTKLSLSPSTIDVETSQGQPLLYPNLIAAGCKLFGTTVTTAHGVNFFIAVSLIISMFFHLSRAFHPWVGLVAGLSLMALPLFFTQSVFVLPEIALAFMLWWTTYGFIHKKFVLYSIFGTAAVLIKEPAVIWILALWVSSFIFYKKEHIRNLLWLIPMLPFTVFLLVQQQSMALYIFSNHGEGLDFSIKNMADKLGGYVEFIFWKQAHQIWTILIVLGGFLVLRKSIKKELPLHLKKHPYIVAIIPVIAYFIFLGAGFFHERYLIAILPIVCGFIGYATYYGVTGQRPVLTLFIATILVFSSFPFMTSDTFNYDKDMTYMRAVINTKEIVTHMLDRGMLLQDEFSATLPVKYAVEDPRYGYLPADSTGRHSTPVGPMTKYVVHTEPGSEIENPANYPLDTLEHWDEKGIRATIYRVVTNNLLQLR